jgi:hypothetical protein
MLDNIAMQKFKKMKTAKQTIELKEVDNLKASPSDEIEKDLCDNEAFKKLTDYINKSKKKTMRFGYLSTLLFPFCPSFVKQKDRKLTKLYGKISQYVNDKLDITHFLKMVENFERLKLLMLSPEQNVSFDFIKSPDLNNEEELDCFELHLNKDRVNDAVVLINYYINRAKRDELDQIDIEMLPLIDPVIRKHMTKNNKD